MEFLDSIQNFAYANISIQLQMRNKRSNMNESMNNFETPYMQGTNLLFDKFFISRSKPEVSFSIDNNTRRKYQNFNKYINGKEHCIMRQTMDYWNDMNSDYPSFLNSPKEYSYVSNSIASYLIGGFVGSKSQMNNDNHKLSFDLGEVIFKILNDYKCYKSFDKFKEEKKFDRGRNWKKSKFPAKDPYEAFECDYNMAIWNSLTNEHKKSEGKEKEKENNSPSQESEKVNSQVLSESAVTNTNDCEDSREPPCDAVAESGTSPGALLNNNDSCHCICLEKPCSTNGLTDNMNKNSILSGDVSWIESGETSNIEKYVNEINLSNVSSPHSICSVFESRRRQCSECSIESTDSESFIVFDDRCCELSYEEIQCRNINEQENDELDIYYEDDDECDHPDEENEDSCWIKTNFECDNLIEERKIKEANAKWLELYSDVDLNEDEVTERKVRFNEEVKLHKIVAWDYAYRAARRGPWEQMVRDRDRFRERIHRLGLVISPVLEESHRELIYKKLCSSSS